MLWRDRSESYDRRSGWRDVDLEAGRIRVSGQLQRLEGKLQVVELKTDSSRRSVSLTGLAINSLTAHHDRLETLPLPSAFVLRSFHRALRKAKLPKIRLHDLRHSCATLLLSEGVHPKVVADLLSHSSTRVTMDVYSHVVERMQQDAAQKARCLAGGSQLATGHNSGLNTPTYFERLPRIQNGI